MIPTLVHTKNLALHLEYLASADLQSTLVALRLTQSSKSSRALVDSMMLRHDEGGYPEMRNRDEALTALKRLSISTAGSRSTKSPRVVGWKGETVEAFRPVDIDVNSDGDAPSPLNSATSFESGKMFWQNLLEEKRVPDLSPSSGSKSSYSDYAEIQITGSTVSSISDGSGFRGMKSSLSVDIPSKNSFQNMAVSNIDNKPRDNEEVGIETKLSALSAAKSDLTNSSRNQQMRKSGEGKNRASPVAYPFGMMPMKSPRFKTMSESFSSPTPSFDCESRKDDVSATGPPAVEQHSCTSWAATAHRNKVKVLATIPQATSNKAENFRSAYGAWQRAGLMKEVRDDSENTREQSVPPTSNVNVVTEKRDSVSEKTFIESSQTLKNNDVVQYYKAWQRAGLMKKNPGLKSKIQMNIPAPAHRTDSASIGPAKSERNASGVVKKAPDANGNPYRVWQRAGLIKSGRRDKENQLWTPVPSSASNVPNLREPKAMAPTKEKSKAVSLPLAPSTAGNVPKASKLFERTPTDESEDQADEFTSIINNVRHSGKEESIPRRVAKDEVSVSSNHRRVGGLSIQTANENGSTVDFFDQVREQLSPRANVQKSPVSVGRGKNTWGKDVVFPKSPANASSVFRAPATQDSENQGFEATIRAGKERLHSWEEKTPKNRNRPRSHHFQEICKSLESSDVKENTLENLGGTRAIVLLERDSRYEVLVGQTNQSSNQKQLVLQNLEVIASEKATETEVGPDGACQCSQSIFSGNDDLIDFFLPQMGMACTCQKQTWVCAKPDDPTAIENVLRPWQVSFLHRFGITHAEELVKARHRSVGILGKAMRQWRMKEGMETFRTSSCIMALDIWSKTCKAYVRSVRKQLGTNGSDLGTREMPRALVPNISKFLLENSPARTPQKSFDSVLA